VQRIYKVLSTIIIQDDDGKLPEPEQPKQVAVESKEPKIENISKKKATEKKEKGNFAGNSF